MPCAMQVPLGTVLSVWALYNPIVMDRVNAWIKTHKRKQRGLGARLVLSEDDLKHMRDDLGVDQKTQISHVQIITQAHGEMITVPTGHAHQVVNKQPCIKLAWDYCMLEKMVEYVACWQHIGAPIMGNNGIEDYTAFMAVISRAVCHLRCAPGCDCHELVG